MSDDLAVYRSPAEGLALVPQVVPLDPWRCRRFGHRLRCRVKDWARKYGYATFADWAREQTTLLSDFDYPTSKHPPSDLVLVWCARCGREWRRDDEP